MIPLSSALLERIDGALNGADLGRVVDELASFTRAVAESPLLARALATADLPDDIKSGLVANVANGRFAPATVDVIVAAASGVRGKEVAPLLFSALSWTVFNAGERDSSLGTIENQLVALARAIQTSSSLRDAFTNAGVSDAPKLAIADDLLGTADAGTKALVETAVVLDQGKQLDTTLLALADAAAARRNVSVADIRTAIELDEERRNALVQALSHSLGKPVEGRFSVDPAIVGSVVIRIGDEVLDGSIRHRLEQARVALATR